ncbi:hypothetical protein LguiA_002231 [Lonicera macranthoides]
MPLLGIYALDLPMIPLSDILQEHSIPDRSIEYRWHSGWRWNMGTVVEVDFPEFPARSLFNIHLNKQITNELFLLMYFYIKGLLCWEGYPINL